MKIEYANNPPKSDEVPLEILCVGDMFTYAGSQYMFCKGGDPRVDCVSVLHLINNTVGDLHNRTLVTQTHKIKHIVVELV